MWCIGKLTKQYRRRMYKILDLYQLEYHSDYPVICMDEKSKQLIENTRKPIKMKAGQVLKEDYEYKRNGTKNLFVAVEPKAGKHIVQLTQTRTKKDFAHFIKRLTDEFYPKAKKITIVLDNLNTHFEKSIIETFCAKESERILNKIEFCHTPVHASWLNMAEIEIGILERECLNRRIANEKEMVDEIKAWTESKNKQKMKINWSFTKRDAYKKLSRKYVS